MTCIKSHFILYFAIKSPSCSFSSCFISDAHEWNVGGVVLRDLGDFSERAPVAVISTFHKKNTGDVQKKRSKCKK